MRKHLLYFAVPFFTLPLFAQTGSTVREDRVWNYAEESFISASPEETLRSTPCPQFHFNGTKILDGKEYAVFMDSKNNEVAFMRQDGDKVYMHLDESAAKDYAASLEIMDAQLPTEVLMYDFGAAPGDRYVTMGYCDRGEVPSYAEIEVVSVCTTLIGGEEARVQNVMQLMSGRMYVIVEGIGAGIGRLDNPQYGTVVTTGMSKIEFYVDRVLGSDGSVIFTREDFDSTKPIVNTVEGVNAGSPGLSYSYGVLRSAEGAELAVYDMAGKLVAQGRGSLSTSSLQPGIYIVKSGVSAIKITV